MLAMTQDITAPARRKRANNLPSCATIRRWAVKIGCDPRSLERELVSPGRVTGEAGRRIRHGMTRIREEIRAAEIQAGEVSHG